MRPHAEPVNTTLSVVSRPLSVVWLGGTQRLRPHAEPINILASTLWPPLAKTPAHLAQDGDWVLNRKRLTTQRIADGTAREPNARHCLPRQRTTNNGRPDNGPSDK